MHPLPARCLKTSGACRPSHPPPRARLLPLRPAPASPASAGFVRLLTDIRGDRELLEGKNRPYWARASQPLNRASWHPPLGLNTNGASCLARGVRPGPAQHGTQKNTLRIRPGPSGSISAARKVCGGCGEGRKHRQHLARRSGRAELAGFRAGCPGHGFGLRDALCDLCEDVLSVSGPALAKWGRCRERLRGAPRRSELSTCHTRGTGPGPPHGSRSRRRRSPRGGGGPRSACFPRRAVDTCGSGHGVSVLTQPPDTASPLVCKTCCDCSLSKRLEGLCPHVFLSRT